MKRLLVLALNVAATVADRLLRTLPDPAVEFTTEADGEEAFAYHQIRCEEVAEAADERDTTLDFAEWEQELGVQS